MSGSIEELNREASQRIYTVLHPEQALNEDGSTPAHIRLVGIEKAADNAPLRCCVIHGALDDFTEQYDALSYCWSSRDAPCEIILQNERYLVTRNLFQALQQIRRSSVGTAVVWIDALCINQLDVEERNFQVDIMHKIYERAATTVIWLGPGTEASDFTMEMLSLRDGSMKTHPDFEALIKNLNEGDSLRFFEGMKDLYTCEYWSRVWIMQELYCSRNHRTEMRWGSKSVDFSIKDDLWDEFAYDGSVVKSGLADVLRQRGRMQKYFAFDRIFSFQGPSVTGLMGLETSAMLDSIIYPILNKHCHDARDYIFGFYHTLPKAFRAYITVDYSESVEEVYRHATRACIQATGNLDILAWPKPVSSCGHHPSWVRDWSAKSLAMAFGCWNVALGSPGSLNLSWEVDGRPLALSAQGAVIGSIAEKQSAILGRSVRAAQRDDATFFELHQELMASLQVLLASEMGDEDQLQFWLLVALGLGDYPDVGVLQNIFHIENVDAMTPDCWQWLADAFEKSMDRVLVEVEDCYVPQHVEHHMLHHALGMANPNVRPGGPNLHFAWLSGADSTQTCGRSRLQSYRRHLCNDFG